MQWVLSLLGAIGLSAHGRSDPVPSVDVAPAKRFDPAREYGCQIAVTDWDGSYRSHHLDFLRRSARATLPRGTPFLLLSGSVNYGEDTSLAWYYRPHLETYTERMSGQKVLERCVA